MASEQSVRLIVEVVGAEESRSKLEQLTSAANATFKNFQSAASTAASGVTSFASTIISSIGGMVKYVAQNMRWASLFVGQKAMDMAKGFIDIAAGVEQSRVAFGTLVGEGAAGELLKWLTEYSLVTPVTREQLAKLVQTFLGYNHTVEEAKRATMATVEAVSALGISETRLGAVTYNLGQLATSTTASYREFRDLQKQGIFTSKLLAGAVADGTIKLAGYGKGTMVVGGATKKMTTAFQGANSQLPILQKSLAAAEAGLKNYNESEKKSEESTLKHEIAVDKARLALDKAKGSVDAYTQAEASRRTVTYDNISTLKQLSREQEEMILKQNTGKEIAIALEEQMIKTYGGAALRQVHTYSGAISNFSDVWQYVVQRAMGISIDGQIKIGGAFDKIRNAVSNLIDYLLKNVDKISGFFEKILESKDALETFAIFLGSTFLGAFLGIIAPILAISAVFALIGIGVKKVIDSMMEGIPSFASMRDAMEKTVLTGDDVKELLKALGIKNSELAKSWAGTKHDLDELEGILRKTGVDTLPEYISKLVETKIRTQEQADATKDSAEKSAEFEARMNMIKEILGKIYKGIRPAIDAITELGKELWNTGVPAALLKSALGFLVEMLRAAIPAIVTVASVFQTLVIAIESAYHAGAMFLEWLYGTPEGVAKHQKALDELGQRYDEVTGRMASAWTNYFTNTETAQNTSGTNMLANQTLYMSQLLGNQQVSQQQMSFANDIYLGTLEANTNANQSRMATSQDTYLSQAIANATTKTQELNTSVNACLADMDTRTYSQWGNIKLNWDKGSSDAKDTVVTNACLMNTDSVFQVKGLMTDSTKALNDGIPEVKKAAGQVCSAVSSQFSQLPGKAKDSGRGTIRGFVEGLFAEARELQRKGFGAWMLGKMGFDVGWLGGGGGGGGTWQHGGIIPGPANMPVPIIAHGGERVTPRGGVDVNSRGFSGNININFYGGVQMDSQSRVDELADRISKMLGRQNELARLGVSG